MVKKLDYTKFKKIVKSYNCSIIFVNKHSSDIVDDEGNYLMSFSINHHSSGKDGVLWPYYKEFIDKVESRR